MEKKTWVCRTWTKVNGDWNSEFDHFATKEEAEEHGKIMEKLAQDDFEIEDRKFEVYSI